MRAHSNDIHEFIKSKQECVLVYVSVRCDLDEPRPSVPRGPLSAGRCGLTMKHTLHCMEMCLGSYGSVQTTLHEHYPYMYIETPWPQHGGHRLGGWQVRGLTH